MQLCKAMKSIYKTKITYTEEERYLQTSLCPPPYFSENQKYKCKDNTKQAKITLHITDCKIKSVLISLIILRQKQKKENKEKPS